ncbi:Otolith matrix protein 1 [Labeo rohita]|uniref:Otolith matrix protein 1 n=1 Tax=Labeo rohita TaxID=84645 RepID=A0ABQ8MY85_LABRO|nr:Otolith matrix protein 1 [Labeo rohita]
MESFSLPSWFLRLLGTLKREQYEPQAFFFFCLFTFFNFTSHTTPLSLSTFGRLLFKVSMDHPGGHLAVVLFLFVLVSMSTENNIIRWCTVSDAEEQKCLDLAGNATARNIRGQLLCVRGQSPTDCMKQIKVNGTADASTMYADEIYTAGFCYGLDVAVGESYNGVDGVNYYVVALARTSSSDLSLLEMHERSSCHPGMRTTVGWTVPIGFLVNTSQISVDEQCNFPHAVGDFFGYSCVPGVKDPEHDPKGNNPRNLRERSPHMRQQPSRTALRGRLELLGKNQESWALDLELEDLKLLCPDGREANLFQHESCHLAVVPTNAVVVRLEDKCRVYKFLERVQNAFANATEGFSLFSSVNYGQPDVLFSDSTKKLLRVMGTYTSWLGHTYTTILKAFECEGTVEQSCYNFIFFVSDYNVSEGAS